MVCVIGEALIDLVCEAVPDSEPGRYLAHPGGSPFNVAIGLARLGRSSRLLARLSEDAFGRQLYEHAAANGVDLSLAVQAGEPSTLAVVSLDAERNARYAFYVNGTADWQWTTAELASMPADADWIHTGSIASWTPPGDAVIAAELARRRAGGSTVLSFDPNIRPGLLGGRDEAVAKVHRLVALSDVVKASVEDLAWLYPQTPVEQVMADWRALGPSVVVVTDGSRGADVLCDSGAFTVPAQPVVVVDTVGAGDAFMAGLINALARDVGADVLRRRAAVSDGSASGAADETAIRPAVQEAILVAALTCARAGANPPTADELAARAQS